jgi:hypothetical protein
LGLYRKRIESVNSQPESVCTQRLSGKMDFW